MDDRYLDIRGLSEYSSLSVRTLRKYLSQIRRYRVDGKILVKISDFDSWMETRVEDSGKTHIEKKADEMMAELGDNG